MGKTLGMNKYQKAAHKPGERRINREQIDELVEMSASDDPEDRLEAAKYLCPCHVRRRIEPVWNALYRMLDDPDVRVRRAAWHTLEDGGHPDDPVLDAIFDRARRSETDPAILRFIKLLDGNRRDKDRLALKLAGRRIIHERGKCDFCGESNVFVERDLETMIPTTGLPRPALICEHCAQQQPETTAWR